MCACCTFELLWVHYISRYISLLHGILSARQKNVNNFQTNNDGLQNSVCLENTMPTPKLVRFEIPNNKHHAQWTTKQYEKLEFLSLSRWKEKNKNGRIFNFVAVFPVYMLNYQRLRVLTRYSTVKFLERMSASIEQIWNIVASSPKFVFSPTLVFCSPICPNNCGVVFLWKYIFVFDDFFRSTAQYANFHR